MRLTYAPTVEETERRTAMPDPITGFRWTFQRSSDGLIDVIGVCDRHQWASRPVPYGEAVPPCPVCQEQDGRIRFAALVRKERVS